MCPSHTWSNVSQQQRALHSTHCLSVPEEDLYLNSSPFTHKILINWSYRWPIIYSQHIKTYTTYRYPQFSFTLLIDYTLLFFSLSSQWFQAPWVWLLKVLFLPQLLKCFLLCSLPTEALCCAVTPSPALSVHCRLLIF